jgi:hypothetical protein
MAGVEFGLEFLYFEILMSNVLAMPVVTIQATTPTNGDWIESIKYVVPPVPVSGDQSTWPQMDLRGITFWMELRRTATDNEVILVLSTDNRKLAIGAFPDVGFLLWFVTAQEMANKEPGNYVGDMIADDGEFTRKIIDLQLTITDGVTR